MHAHADILTQHRQVLSKIELLAQLVRGRVSFANMFYGGGRKQPLRQGVFPHARARRR